MKKLIITFLSLLFLNSCSDNAITEIQEQQKLEIQGIYTFPNSSEFKNTRSRSGSTFETDWENCQTINMSSGEKLHTPWGETSVGNVDDELMWDVKKRMDGQWYCTHSTKTHLLFPNFDTSYFIIKLPAILRFFITIKQRPCNTTMEYGVSIL